MHLHILRGWPARVKRRRSHQDGALVNAVSRKPARAAAGPAYSIEAAVPYLLNRIVNRLNRRLVEELKTLGLTFRDWRVLAFLAATERRTIVELAAYSVIPHSTLSRLLDRMARDGLVRRDGAEHDLRAVALTVTPAGRKLYERVLPLALGLNAELLAGFSAEERRILNGFLGRLRDNLGLDYTPAARPRAAGAAAGSAASSSDSATRSRSPGKSTAGTGARYRR
jgi:DNA-binding MarR family transcriptional regulator